MPLQIPLNPALEHLPVYRPGRPIDEVARELGLAPDAILKLASNENPLGPSPKAVAALKLALSQVHLYPDGNSFHLKNRLAASLALDPSNLILGSGSCEIIEFIGHALLSPNSSVVISQYSFAMYPIVAHLFGARLITVPAVHYGHDIPAMRRAVCPDTRVVFVANPNNPTGTRAPDQEILDLIESIPPETLLVLDEAYLEFLENPPDLLGVIRSGRFPNLLLLRTFSKIYGLAGLRVGYGIGHPELLASFEKIRQPFNINCLAQAAALAALDDPEHVQRTRLNNFEGLGFLSQGLGNLGIEFVPSTANFILARVGNGQHVFEALQQHGVITRPMASYQLPEWLRISVGTPPENRRCLDALRSILEKQAAA